MKIYETIKKIRAFVFLIMAMELFTWFELSLFRLAGEMHGDDFRRDFFWKFYITI